VLRVGRCAGLTSSPARFLGVLALRRGPARLSTFMRMVIAAAWVWLALAPLAGARALAPVSDPDVESESAFDAARSGELANVEAATRAQERTERAEQAEQALERTDGVCGFVSAAASPAAVRGSASPRPASHSRLVPRPFDDESQPAWCLAPNDPRCTPRDVGASSEASRIPLPPPPAANEFGSLLRPVAAVAPPQVRQLGMARAGVHGRLERPPRFGRRVG